ncbi:MAG: hypothetical protein WBA13_11260 [Microcoleaceae cyanobacterium]
MIQPIQLKKINSILKCLFCSSLILSVAIIASAGGPPPERRGKPVEEEVESGKPVEEEDTDSTTHPAPASESTPGAVPDQFPLPSARVSPVNGQVTLRLVNASNTLINYQVVGGTRERTLGEQSQTELAAFPLPLTLTYQRQDAGLLLVFPRSIEPGVLEVRFQATSDFDLDTKSLNIPENGSVFLN